MTGDILRCAFSADCASGAGTRPFSLPWLWQAFGAGGPSSRPVQPANLLVTLCIRCHIRIHHLSGLRYCFSAMLVRLWRELHPNDPLQLQLSFRKAAKRKNSKGVLEEVSVTVLPLWQTGASDSEHQARKHWLLLHEQVPETWLHPLQRWTGSP